MEAEIARSNLSAILRVCNKFAKTMSTFFNPPAPSEAQMEGENIRRMFYLFLNEYQSKNEEGKLVYFYREEAYNMMMNKRTTMNINFRHLMDRDGGLMEAINFDYYKYRRLDLGTNRSASELFTSS